MLPRSAAAPVWFCVDVKLNWKNDSCWNIIRLRWWPESVATAWACEIEMGKKRHHGNSYHVVSRWIMACLSGPISNKHVTFTCVSLINTKFGASRTKGESLCCQKYNAVIGNCVLEEKSNWEEENMYLQLNSKHGKNCVNDSLLGKISVLLNIKNHLIEVIFWLVVFIRQTTSITKNKLTVVTYI